MNCYFYPCNCYTQYYHIDNYHHYQQSSHNYTTRHHHHILHSYLSLYPYLYSHNHWLDYLHTMKSPMLLMIDYHYHCCCNCFGCPFLMNTHMLILGILKMGLMILMVDCCMCFVDMYMSNRNRCLVGFLRVFGSLVMVNSCSCRILMYSRMMISYSSETRTQTQHLLS